MEPMLTSPFYILSDTCMLQDGWRGAADPFLYQSQSFPLVWFFTILT